MAISVDWATKIITVPEADLTLVQSVPSLVYSLEINTFRLELSALMASEDGMPYPDIYNHNTTVLLSGLEYARVIEIINGYTITFEDGQYAVNLIGANSNIQDNVNVNQVSVRASNSAGMTSSSDIEYGSFNNHVTINELTGFAGTTFPIGTLRKPVNNWSDALLIAEYRGFNEIGFFGDVSLDSAVDLDNYKIAGQNAVRSSLTIASAPTMTNCEITNTLVMGTLDGDTLLRECMVNGITYFNGVVHQTAFLSPAVILAGGINTTAMLLSCYSGVPGADDRPTIDFDDTETNLAIRNWTGGIELLNKSTVAGAVSVDVSSGTVYVRSSCTAGTITVRGVGKLVDESGPGCTVESSGLVSNEATAASTWDAFKADHVIPGTYGSELATKADLYASASTDQSSAVSGSVINGILVSGTFADLATRDGSYWQIGEDAANGVSVEMAFNLPSASHRAGSVNIFGRYNGQPAGTHYMDLFAYNYEAAAWEQLVEEFIPGGGLSDAAYSHEFYERHIDRDNNNEVKIRLTHNVTSYNASHTLSLDYVDASSIKVITAADISEAVWDNILEGTYTAAHVMQVMSSILAGKVSGAAPGAVALAFRDLSDKKDRVVSNVDGAGNRTGITLDVD